MRIRTTPPDFFIADRANADGLVWRVEEVDRKVHCDQVPAGWTPVPGSGGERFETWDPRAVILPAIVGHLLFGVNMCPNDSPQNRPAAAASPVENALEEVQRNTTPSTVITYTARSPVTVAVLM